MLKYVVNWQDNAIVVGVPRPVITGYVGVAIGRFDGGADVVLGDELFDGHDLLTPIVS
jgi:hypothetical protein